MNDNAVGATPRGRPRRTTTNDNATIAARKPLDWATQSGRNAVSQQFGLGNREFATPVLYMRAADGEIF